MQELGKEVVRKLKIIPAQVVVEHRYYAYTFRQCDTEGIETPVTSAERKKSVIRAASQRRKPSPTSWCRSLSWDHHCTARNRNSSVRV